MKTVSLLHPFSAQAIGLKETDLYYNHSKPHENALKILQKEGYEVRIEYFTGKWMPLKKQLAGISKIFWPVTTPLFKGRHTWRKQHSTYHLLKNRVSPADLTIINMSGHGSPYIFKLAKLLRKKNKYYVAMIGGIHMSYHTQAIEYYKNAHHVVVHTQIQKDQLKQRAEFKNIPIKVIPLGVDTTVFLPTQQKQQLGNLLFVGRISRLKQIEKAIESLAYIIHTKKESAHLRIIGPVSDRPYFEELKALVTNLKLQDQISFLGSLSQQDIIPFYQKANLLLLPSKHESFGMVMIEAMACGTPVIALQGAGGPDELIEHGVTGFLCDDTNFNEKVFEVLSSESVFLNLSQNSRASVLQNWSLDYTTSCFRNTLEEVFLST